MSDVQLPNNWELKTIGDIADTTGGYGFPKRFQGEKNLPFPFAKVSDMNLPENETYIVTAVNTVDQKILDDIRGRTCPPGTIIFPKIGGAIATNKKRILGVEAIFDNNVMGIIPDKSKVLTKWCYYYLVSIDLMQLANIGPVPSIRQSTLQEFPIPIPYPDDPERSLDVQQRIVARIEALLAEVREMRKLHDEITADADALMNAVLAEVFENLKCSYEAMMDCCAILGGGTLPAPEPEESLHDGVLLLKVSELNREENIPVITTSTHMISMQTAEKRNLRVISPGSIIIPKRGGAIATNKKRLLSRKAILDPNLMAITPNNSQLKPKFLYYWFEKLNLSTISSGSTVPQINRKDLAPLEIPILSEDKQLTIVTYLDHIHTEIYEMQKNLADEKPMLKVVEQAILSQAFRGEL